MKNIILIIAAVLISTISYSQINLENTFVAGQNLTEISDGDYKYFTVNEKKQLVTVYNLDNTIFKTVKLAIPEDAFLDEILNVSSSKINENSNVEVAYTVYYETSDDEFDYIENTVYEHTDLIIIDESGAELLKVKEGKSIKFSGNSESLMLISAYNNDNLYQTYKTYVYSTQLNKTISRVSN